MSAGLLNRFAEEIISRKPFNDHGGRLYAHWVSDRYCVYYGAGAPILAWSAATGWLGCRHYTHKEHGHVPGIEALERTHTFMTEFQENGIAGITVRRLLEPDFGERND